MEVYEPVSVCESIQFLGQIEAEIMTMNVPYVLGKLRGKDVLVQCRGSACTATVVGENPEGKRANIETTRQAPKVVQSLLDDIKWRLR